MSTTEKYDDIIHLPHPVSEKHPRMPMLDRAAQFSTFAARTGYEEAIYETGRLTEEKTELDEEEKARFRAAVQPMYDRFAQQGELIARIRQA